MKKIAVAVASALLATSALAANVDLYGRIDTGLVYSHHSATDEGSENLFEMSSGASSGSRWGLKGSEELSDGYKVGFVLESGFNSDDGTFGSSGKIFNRESQINVETPFGTVYAGRMTSLIGDSGSVGWYGSMASPFGTGWADTAGHAAVFSTQGRFDNTLVYMSPRVSGLQFSAQYSMGGSYENKPSDDRYAAIGLSYENGPVALGFLVDYLNKNSSYNGDYSFAQADGSTELSDVEAKAKDAYTVNLAGSYNCGFATTYLALQYFRNVRDINGVLSDTRDDLAKDIVAGNYASAEKAQDAYKNFYNAAISLRGFGVNVGTSFDALGGNIMISAGYSDADLYANSTKSDESLKAYTALVGYTYAFSKRTSMYVGAGYTQYNVKDEDGTDKDKVTQVMTGLLHKF